MYKYLYFIFFIFKLWLILGIPLLAFPYASHDDRLFLNLANHIIEGNWLGPYNNTTLVKTPFYSIWIALNFYTGLPLLISQTLLYGLSISLATYWFKKESNTEFIPFLLFLFLLFNPYLDCINSVTREGIYPALTLGFIASILLSLFFYKVKRNFFIFIILSGVFLLAFWLTREEAIWILPFIVTIYGYWITTEIILFKNKGKIYKFIDLFIPFIILGIGLTIVSTLNKSYYDYYGIADTKSDNYKSAIASLARVNPIGELQPYILLNKTTREKLYEVSPSFNELRYLLEDKNNGWKKYGCVYSFLPDCDYTEGWFYWALRDAVSEVGYYYNTSYLFDYWDRVANEIDEACENGSLDCRLKIPGEIPQFRDGDFKLFGSSSLNLIKVLGTGFRHTSIGGMSIGDEESLNFFRDITNTVNIQSSTNENGIVVLEKNKRISDAKIFILNNVKKVYDFILFPVMSLLLTIFLLIIFASAIVNYKNVNLMNVVIFSLSATILTRVLLLAMIDATSFPTVLFRYVSPLYPLLIFLFFVSLQYLLKNGVFQKNRIGQNNRLL